MRWIARSRIAGAGAAIAAAYFSFEAIEFAPPESRLPQARGFVARAAAPGTPIADAVRAMRRAGAACRAADDGLVRCTASRPIQHSDDDGRLGDVTWTVRLYPGADGRVRTADVDRIRAGL